MRRNVSLLCLFAVPLLLFTAETALSAYTGYVAPPNSVRPAILERLPPIVAGVGKSLKT